MKPSFYFFRKGLICIYERKNVRLFSPLSSSLSKFSQNVFAFPRYSMQDKATTSPLSFAAEY